MQNCSWMHINRQGLKFWCRNCPLGAVYCLCHNYVLKCLISFVLLSKWALILFSCNQVDLASVVTRVVASHFKKRKGECHLANQWPLLQSLRRFPTARSRITLQVPSPPCHSSGGRIAPEQQHPTQHCGMEVLALLQWAVQALLSNSPSPAFSIAFAGSMAPPAPERELWCLCPRRHSGMDWKSAVTVRSTGALNKQKVMAGSFHLRMGDSAWPALFPECWEKSGLIAQTSEQLL